MRGNVEVADAMLAMFGHCCAVAMCTSNSPHVAAEGWPAIRAEISINLK